MQRRPLEDNQPLSKRIKISFDVVEAFSEANKLYLQKNFLGALELYSGILIAPDKNKLSAQNIKHVETNQAWCFYRLESYHLPKMHFEEKMHFYLQQNTVSLKLDQYTYAYFTSLLYATDALEDRLAEFRRTVQMFEDILDQNPNTIFAGFVAALITIHCYRFGYKDKCEAFIKHVFEGAISENSAPLTYLVIYDALAEISYSEGQYQDALFNYLEAERIATAYINSFDQGIVKPYISICRHMLGEPYLLHQEQIAIIFNNKLLTLHFKLDLLTRLLASGHVYSLKQMSPLISEINSSLYESTDRLKRYEAKVFEMNAKVKQHYNSVQNVLFFSKKQNVLCDAVIRCQLK